MSIPDPDAETGQDAVSGAARAPQDGEAGRRERLHQPWRAAVAVCEVIAAAGLLLLAWTLWDTGVVYVALARPDGAPGAGTRLFGSWLSLAVLSATVAGVLVLDAGRQGVLAWAVRPRRSGTGEQSGHG